MLSLSVDSVRLFLHVLAATIWVGGQITLGALVPVLRGYGEAPKAAARQFAYVGWTAFVVLVLTGVWNIAALDHPSSAVKTTLNIKMGIVVLSGLAAYLHGRAKTKAGLAAWGAISAVAALAAVLFGVMISEAPTP
jgi:putative copper export protein